MAAHQAPLSLGFSRQEQLYEVGAIISPMLQTWKLRPRDVTVLPKVTQLGSGRTQVRSSSAIHALTHSAP